MYSTGAQQQVHNHSLTNCLAGLPVAVALCTDIGDRQLRHLAMVLGRGILTIISSSSGRRHQSGGQNVFFLCARLTGLPVSAITRTGEDGASISMYETPGVRLDIGCTLDSRTDRQLRCGSTYLVTGLGGAALVSETRGSPVVTYADTHTENRLILSVCLIKIGENKPHSISIPAFRWRKLFLPQGGWWK